MTSIIKHNGVGLLGNSTMIYHCYLQVMIKQNQLIKYHMLCGANNTVLIVVKFCDDIYGSTFSGRQFLSYWTVKSHEKYKC